MSKKVISLCVLIVFDLTVVFCSFILAILLRNEILPNIFYKFKLIPASSILNFMNYYYISLVWVSVFAYEKLYTKRYPFWEEFKVLIKSATIASSIIMIFIFITRKQLQFSRTVVVLAWLLSLFLFPLFRYFLKIILVKANLWKQKLIIIGVHTISLDILRSIKKDKTMGYEVIGFIDNDPEKKGKKFGDTKVIGLFTDLEDISKVYKSKDIMITTPHMPRRNLKEFLSRCESISDSMWLVPRTGDFITEGVKIEVIGDVLTLYVKKNLAKPWNIFIKGFYEELLTLVIVILLIPIFVLITMAIKLDSKGPIIFKQKRLGRRRKMFSVIKFRSMYVNSEKILEEYLNKDQKAKAEWRKYKKLRSYDPRVTKVGKFIRKYSLDELPQLFNVLQGKMSLVGPRPYLLDELEGKDLFIETITKTKPGITGLWQISGRSELLFEERLALDEHYIRNWSLWLDIIILLKSIKVVFSPKGAY